MIPSSETMKARLEQRVHLRRIAANELSEAEKRLLIPPPRPLPSEPIYRNNGGDVMFGTILLVACLIFAVAGAVIIHKSIHAPVNSDCPQIQSPG